MTNLERFKIEYSKAVNAGTVVTDKKRWLDMVFAHVNLSLTVVGISIDSTSFQITAKALGIKNQYKEWEKFFTQGGEVLPAIKRAPPLATQKRVAESLVKLCMQTNRITYPLDKDFIATILCAMDFFDHMKRSIPLTYKIEKCVLAVSLPHKLTLEELGEAFKPQA